jgi:hypothetical protein
MNPWIRRLFAVAIVCAFAPGCSTNQDGIDRVSVSGAVTLDGEPLKSGSITFSPKGNGPSAGGVIEDGSYSVSTEAGPSAGKYSVEIRSMAPTGRKIPNYDGAPGEMMEETYDIVPPNYNSRTELNVEFKNGSKNVQDFALTGKLPVPQAGSTKKSGNPR